MEVAIWLIYLNINEHDSVDRGLIIVGLILLPISDHTGTCTLLVCICLNIYKYIESTDA